MWIQSITMSFAGNEVVPSFWESVELRAAFIGIVSGGLGYLVARFWVRPILRFNDVRHSVFSDLMYYANAVYGEGMSSEHREQFQQRKLAQRRDAAELRAVALELPVWYRWWLARRGFDTQKASGSLIGLSNSNDWPEAEPRIEKICAALRLPEL